MSLQLNAIANRAAGKGYENEDNYSNIKFQFVGIENIHVMRNSQQKMLEGNYRSPQSQIFQQCLPNEPYVFLVSSSAVELRPHVTPVASCRLGPAAMRPQVGPQENFWVLCRGAPRKTLNPSGFDFRAILVSWSGQSGILFPKERARA